MKTTMRYAALAIAVVSMTGPAEATGHKKKTSSETVRLWRAQLGPRPFYLVDKLEDGKLKKELTRCMKWRFAYRKSDFSIGHRGACLQFPEHTVESYVAAARQGAGILECDVTITKDLELVCRHAQCDLHTTTNILATDLAHKCTQGFEPAVYDDDGELVTPASAKCCTSDITLAEFKTLKGKMDAADSTATTVEDYISGPKATPKFRTDLYATGATLLSHAESIQLFKKLGTQFTPELKGADRDVGLPPGITQDEYAQKMIDEYREAGISPKKVWAQSFNIEDVRYWIANEPRFGEQAVYLEGRNPVSLVNNPPPQEEFDGWKHEGINVLAPPMPTLLDVDVHGNIVPSVYAKRARKAGLEIISWTTERSGRINEDIKPSGGAFYYNTTVGALSSDGDILKTIDVLVQDVGIFGLFSDWPATTTFYANCKDIPRLRAMKKKARRSRDDDDDR